MHKIIVPDTGIRFRGQDSYRGGGERTRSLSQTQGSGSEGRTAIEGGGVHKIIVPDRKLLKPGGLLFL